jgi:signal transduction histidine kinase
MLVIIGWLRRLNLIRRQLGSGAFTRLHSTGERELDRLVEALNSAGEGVAETHDRLDAAEQPAAVGRLSAGLGRLDALLRDVLTITQRRELHSQLVNVETFLQDEAQAHQELASLRGISIGVSVAPEARQACFDPVHMGRAVDNLVLNALQLLPAGGRLRLAARPEGPTLCLRVDDDGPRVSANIRARLFAAFVTGRADGTGLGLASEEIARAPLLLSNEKGSVFEIQVAWQPC